MSEHTLARITRRLSSLPSIALPTDYPRPSHSSSQKVVEASIDADLNHRASLALARLSLYEDDNLDANSSEAERANPPSPFHILLATFLALLHRYTGETDIVVATSSPSAEHPDPLLLRAELPPDRTFWGLVRAIEQLEKEAESDHVPFETLLQTVGQREHDGLDSPYAPLFRVRFLDAMDQTESDFIHSTSLTTDLTIIVKSSVPSTALRSSHEPILPRPVSLTFLYNSLLFTSTRMHLMIDQLSMLLIQASMRPSAKLSTIPFLTPAQLSLLPDPRQDLNWTTWPGPITRIFSSNAHRHPQKLCVSEHLINDQPCKFQHPPKSHMRTFTYQQIDEASNILAHHLLAGGIQPEEVVTIYSTRGVDLVVAILGILKAGATFSVIDPAYPNQRQKIYLEVSRPRGLIVLERAGRLSHEVQTFIDDQLSIKVTVPALSLQDDGSLLGGFESASERQDVLAHTQALSTVLPDVKLGPDSVGTLSFTSGSTGIPKGVKGRHYSLTHFFPWMATEFKLDANSKFTMLSGIAHDPIQRDIFTPLFLGAELHIPTAEDIGTPGRLAEWMDDSRITVTHLTPAMGQLLSAQATRQIPSLQNAFFVGDILTKRDCTRLQQLAPNVMIINMFGTTETQRAVSYCPIPPIAKDPIYLDTKKDIIPAGRGMKDVQLLVVNRFERSLQCGVGELGEIYVRSSGLAEGYLGPAEVSAEKFLPNWFTSGIVETKASDEEVMEGKWLGVRDRVYKTGDLGRYLPDGTVECVGRLDDQIKIRGFRIELGEIDTHLSQHPAIRENVTLVRRDKDEEKILVSYFVPMARDEAEGLVSGSEVEDEEEEEVSELEKGIRKYRKLIKHIREYLKTKLPTYSIPTLFVPLVRMPLNPNGKIDKPALPFPDTARQVTSSHIKPKPSSCSDLTPTQSTIQSIWQSLLPNNIYSTSVIPVDESFFDLGGHSILATRLVFEIRRMMAVNAPLGLVFEHPTIGGLAHQVDLLKNADFGIAKDDEEKAKSDPATFDYAADGRALIKTLKLKFSKPSSTDITPKTVFLTGATGFLGAFILRALLGRPTQIGKVVCHLRAKTREAGLARLREACESRGFWEEAWVMEGRVEVVLGDLESRQIGLTDSVWAELSERVDVVVHNGALVHWVYPYSKLRSANVLGTLALLEFVSTGKPKMLTFVSSTAVLEKAHYVDLSDVLIQRGGRGVPETDDLEAGATGLTTGYGQTKWVSERLIMEAGRRGLCGSIIRPAYIVGDSRTGVTNTDDFLWRLVKGCVQIGAIPDIHNTVNMLPVDEVARCTMLASVRKPTDLKVFHLTARPLPRMNAFLDTLATYGYNVAKEDYLTWRIKLEQSVLGRGPEDNALFPLLHFVLNDLPSSTKSAELDDSNTINLLGTDDGEIEMTVKAEQVGIYLAWLVRVGFLPVPEAGCGLELPALGGGAGWAVGRSGH
ncbi:hypothetical protein CROQUDRAFT_88921 [Cronartium quercuum f. sp. fusiforme G11]|uniref:Alpha-aminoadipate reductase n=1 Tax=Cronartium quercuum f. sp. fusiforme G11 TaxID=708437 RepID=A0A9P6NSQ9_9BASI|nr:hypothetical protein CROQUDRAFT_88921 [Cronartium quercuum f. sp. fusiforme G11]